jgi:hypothetical protein
MTPLFYYLPYDRYQFVSKDFDVEIRKHSSSRVWVIKLEGLDLPPDLVTALNGRESVHGLEARFVAADLYERP